MPTTQKRSSTGNNVGFKTITFKGFTAQITARVGGYRSAIYLEMAGAEASVKAIWARLVSAKVKKSGYADGVTIGGSTVSMEKNTKYITLRTVLPNDQHVVGLLHPMATVIGKEKSFYLVAPADLKGPPPAFFPRLAAVLAVPVKEEWAPWLWKKGLEVGEYDYQKLICSLTSSGHVVGYRVQTHDSAAWLKLIQEGIGLLVCKQCSKVARELVEDKFVRGYASNQHEVTRMICQECKRGER